MNDWDDLIKLIKIVSESYLHNNLGRLNSQI